MMKCVFVLVCRSLHGKFSIILCDAEGCVLSATELVSVGRNFELIN